MLDIKSTKPPRDRVKEAQSQHRTYSDTKYPAQRRFISLEGTSAGVRGSGLSPDWEKTATGVPTGVVFKDKRKEVCARKNW